MGANGSDRRAGHSVVVVGAGPAGLTAAYLLAKRGARVCVLESDPEYVGGISRTIRRNGFCFDIGGHRFFSKSEAVERFWSEILSDDLLVRPRSSRILYRGKLFRYPLKPAEALFQLGVFESLLCVASYMKSVLFPIAKVRSFKDWVSNQFGQRLFEIFFKTYTEKVWGMPCEEISSDWAAQRIKGFSLGTAIRHAVESAFRRKQTVGDRSKAVKTLIESFRYPRKGPGMLWEKCAERVLSYGGRVELGCPVDSASYDGESREWTVFYKQAGLTKRVVADHLISSAPIREMANGLCPRLSPEALASANSLKYRDFITVALAYRGEEIFKDNWVYIHDPNVKVGRIQNFRSWSPDMVPGPEWVCYGLEYFCFEGDGLWAMNDRELIELARKEMEQLGFPTLGEYVEGHVVRQPKAYPVYDDEYSRHVSTLRRELEERFPSFHPIGRNGMHKYNNQDHAIMTAMLTVENILSGSRLYDVWKVNQDAEYHEEDNGQGSDSGQALRSVPERRNQAA